MLINIVRSGSLKVVSASLTFDDGYMTLLLQTNSSSVRPITWPIANNAISLSLRELQFPADDTYMELTDIPNPCGGSVAVKAIDVDPDGCISIAFNINVDSEPVEIIDYSNC